MAKECPQYLFDQAVALLEKDPFEALEVWQDLTRQFPSDSDVRANYGFCLLRTNQPYAAVPQLELATQRNADLNSLQALLEAYSLAGMLTHGIKTARRIRDRGGQDLVATLEEVMLVETLPEKLRLEFERCHLDVELKPSIGSLNRMAAFAKKSGGFIPAYNNVVSTAIELMDWKRAFETSNAVLALAPDNIHALFGRVRLECLTSGVDTAQSWLERVRAAPVGEGVKIHQSEATQAQTLALLNDQAGVQKVVEAYQQRLEANPLAENVLFEALKGVLELRKTKPDHPFLDLEMFFPRAALKHWQAIPEKQFLQTVTAELKTMPGVLEFLRDYWRFEAPSFLTIFASVLVGNPELPVPNDSRSWFDIFKEVLSESKDAEVRTLLSRLFLRKELMTSEELTELTGSSIYHLEIHEEAAPTPYSKQEYNNSVRALEQMRQGNLAQARAILEPLVKRYPNHAIGKFNLALTYLHDSTVPNGKAHAEVLFLELLEQHPSYLFARAELAELAMKRGHLSAATDFLQFPKDLIRVHAVEYAAYSSAIGRLALREGKTDFARQCLETIAAIQGEDSAAYLVLEAAFHPQSQTNVLSSLLESGKNLFQKS
jgi:tetratricopeptide (TPR) repeat protein